MKIKKQVQIGKKGALQLGFLGSIIAALILWYVLNQLSGITDPILCRLLGTGIAGSVVPIVIMMLFFPQIWNIVINIFRTIYGLLTRTKEGIDKAAKGDWRIIYGLIIIIISILRFSGIGLNVECADCKPYCLEWAIGICVVGVVLFIWGLRSGKTKKKREEVTDFAFIDQKRKDEIINAENYVAARIQGYHGISRIVSEYTNLVEETRRQEVLEKTRRKSKDRYEYADLEGSYQAKRTELINTLLKKRVLVGEVYKKSREKLTSESKSEDEIKRIQADMTVNAFTKKIIEDMSARIPWFKKKEKTQYDYRDYWA